MIKKIIKTVVNTCCLIFCRSTNHVSSSYIVTDQGRIVRSYALPLTPHLIQQVEVIPINKLTCMGFLKTTTLI